MYAPMISPPRLTLSDRIRASLRALTVRSCLTQLLGMVVSFGLSWLIAQLFSAIFSNLLGYGAANVLVPVLTFVASFAFGIGFSVVGTRLLASLQRKGR